MTDSLPELENHGSNLRLTYKVEGKTVTETFPRSPQRKAEREIAGFRRYHELSRELVDTKEKIWPISIFLAPCRSSISTTHASICGN